MYGAVFIMSAKAKQYNLHSHKGTSIQVPVEFQVSDDQQFLNSILQNSTLSQQTNDDSSDSELSVSLNLSQRSKLGFYVPFNSQGHIGTGPQNCHLWDSNPQR